MAPDGLINVKVKDLKSGMLYKPTKQWEVVKSGWMAFRNNGSEFNPNGASVIIAASHKARQSPMLFIETKQDDYTWAGVRRHHYFLWEGEGIIMSGYDIRYLEAIQGEENE